MEFQVAVFPAALVIAVAAAIEDVEYFGNIAAKHFGTFEQVILVGKSGCWGQGTAVILLVILPGQLVFQRAVVNTNR